MTSNDALLTLNLAIQTLYAQMFRPEPDLMTLGEAFQANLDFCDDEESAASEIDATIAQDALEIARGVYENQASLDDIIRQYLRGWKLERLGMLELLLLRTGLYSMIYKGEEEKSVAKAIKKLLSSYNLQQARDLLTGVLAACDRDRKMAAQPEE